MLSAAWHHCVFLCVSNGFTKPAFYLEFSFMWLQNSYHLLVVYRLAVYTVLQCQNQPSLKKFFKSTLQHILRRKNNNNKKNKKNHKTSLHISEMNCNYWLNNGVCISKNILIDRLNILLLRNIVLLYAKLSSRVWTAPAADYINSQALRQVVLWW